MKRYAAFILAGGCGFLADAAVLLFLTRSAVLDPFVSRLASFTIAMCVTWMINRVVTFGPSHRPVLDEGRRYAAVAIGVGLFNYAAYSAPLLLVPGFPPLAALVIASAASMVLSFVGYSRLVFAR